MTFTPGASGSRSSTLSVSYSGGDGASPVTSALSGTGTSQTVATPAISPSAGSYSSPQTVSISDSTGGATICYTIDGSTPTTNGAGSCTHGTTYSGSFSQSIPATVEAVGSESGYSDSSVASNTYTLSGGSGSSSFASNLHATSVSSGSVSLAWTASSGASPTYNVYRSPRFSGVADSFTEIASGVSATSFTDAADPPYTPVNGQAYAYRITTVIGGVESSPANTILVYVIASNGGNTHFGARVGKR
ncbi:MAG TPA: chitobiase/beta-hexosaminidase C-terminal domain-containing protein [Candidatus Acidoferrales bacterium]|nr:chitobiase/beta-hexosaminidase C-terminal domain-containing protein [Candidatus Acidoferrales bacterium]